MKPRDQKSYCVYCHTNNENGKKYIGITSQKPEHRWQNGNGYKYNSHFYNAILKYGWNNFSHDILFDNLSAKEASDREINLIKSLMTANPEYGYNLSLGGEHNEGGITEETRKKLSRASSNMSDETKEKHRRNMIERNKSKDFAYKRTKSVLESANKRKKEIREIFSHYWHNPPTEDGKKRIALAHQKKVLCVETGKMFESISIAADYLGVTRKAVGNVLTGRNKRVKGFTFIYVDC